MLKLLKHTITNPIPTRECKPGGYFSNPGLRVWRHSNPDIWHYGGPLFSGRLANRVVFKQLRGGQMEVWLDTQTIQDEAYYRNVSWNNTTWALRVRVCCVNYTETVTFISVFCSQAAIAKQR